MRNTPVNKVDESSQSSNQNSHWNNLVSSSDFILFFYELTAHVVFPFFVLIAEIITDIFT